MQDIHQKIQERLNTSPNNLEKFCHEKGIIELSVFGSILREDFCPDSDIDLLVKFAPDCHISLLGIIRLENELKELLNREVDLVSKKAVENSQNWLRRQQILGSAEVIYVQGSRNTH